MNYPIGDFLIRLKNTALAGRKTVEVSSSKLVRAVARLLQKEGYLEDVTESKGTLSANLAFHKKSPILDDIKLVSKPGLRIYMDREELEAKKGPSFFIISTSHGLMTTREALKKGLGGEVIAEVL
jgi:small subunit ribosomal protein S8